jgi:ABC-type transport system involved in multi-copper enzyme maturation permease subunit
LTVLVAAGGSFEYFLHNAGYVVGAAIVIGGLLYGLKDIGRLSLARAGAIAGVSFSESIRRRVLLVTPVAIIGILAVAQFLDPTDPQDALRQTTKVCLFATGLVVVITGIILACTNLPKEIESRVIYTIVTKPTTRLEIVLGKIAGFSAVSLVILLIMGAFTLGYLKLREWRARAWLREQLAAGHVDLQNRSVFQLYADKGLLVTKSLAGPQTAMVAARPPAPGQPAVITGGESQYFAVPFELTGEQKRDIRAALATGKGAFFVLNSIGYEQRLPTEAEAKQIRDLRLPTTAVGDDSDGPSLLPSLPTLAPIRLPVPQVIVHLYTKDMDRLDERIVNEGKALDLPQAGGRARAVPAFIDPQYVEQVLALDRFYVLVNATTPTVDYQVSETPTVLAFSTGPDAAPQLIPPAPSPADPSRPTPPLVEAHRGRFGMQLRGKSGGGGSMAVFPFRGVEVRPAGGGTVTFEANIGIESAGEFDRAENVTPHMSLQVHNRSTDRTTDPIDVRVESNRVVPVSVPAEFVSGGDFDVYLRGFNDGVWYGVEKQSLSLVRSAQPFSLNLFKSLLILWLMAILVVSIAVFCSTFLSWPIAIVLTLFILLGHWGVSQLGEIAGAQIGAEVTQSLGLDNPTAARFVRGGVGFLTDFLTFVAQFLPDVSKFPVTDDIERGVSIPPATIGQAGWVLLGYGVPITLGAYMILRNKEVAP